MLFNREMKRVYDGGTLGKVLYAEGEYNHAGNVYSPVGVKDTFDSLKHWRMFLPRTYYLTHSLGPLMYTTGSNPIRVTAMPIQFDPPTDSCRAGYVNEKAAIITCLNDDRSVFKITGHASLGASDNSYRICGDRGQIENVRGSHGWVMLRYNDWQIPEGREEINLYDAVIDDPDEELIRASAHGGGDYVTIRMFVEYIKENRSPEHPFNVDSAVAMASCAILGHRSMLEGGKPYEIPDFNDEKWCKLYENDYLTPFYGVNGEEPTLPCCSVTDYKPTDKQIEKYLNSLK
jgi:predicted dehydrogenase